MKIETMHAASFRRLLLAPTTSSFTGEVRPQRDRNTGTVVMGAADLAAIATPGNPAWSRLIT